jgi:hypothetical protein
MKTQTVLLALLGVLVLLAGVQAYQLSLLSQTLSPENLAALAPQPAANLAPATTQKTSVLANLPTQVGGCG